MIVRAVSLSLVIVLLLLLLLLSDVPAQGFGAAAGEHEPLEKDLEAAPDSSFSYYLPFVSGKKFSVQMKKGFRARMIPTSGAGTTSTHSSFSAPPPSCNPVFRVTSSLILLVAFFFV